MSPRETSNPAPALGEKRKGIHEKPLSPSTSVCISSAGFLLERKNSGDVMISFWRFGKVNSIQVLRVQMLW